MKAKYVNPYTDFGFKKIFGEEASKPLLLDFLQSLLPQVQLTQLSFKDKEKQGNTHYDRKAIYDLYCENEKGEKLIIELQKAKHNYFKDRTVFYSTFPIQEQAEQGDWNYKLNAVYCIGILDFCFNDESAGNDVIHTVQLKNQHHQVFYNKLMFVYVEMPNFKKKENELETRLDKWLYFIKHLENFETIPEIFKDSVFVQAFAKAEIAAYNQTERDSYETSLKTYRDMKSVVDTAYDEGVLQGIVATALKAIEKGFDDNTIADLTGLSISQIQALRKQAGK